MTLVDYPLFSGVVVIHSLHVSSFQEAHHQEFIFPCTVSLWYSVYCNMYSFFLWLFLKHSLTITVL